MRRVKLWFDALRGDLRQVNLQARQMFVVYSVCFIVFFGLAMVGVTDLLLRGEDWADGLGLLLRGLIVEAVFFPLLGFGFFGFLTVQVGLQIWHEYQAQRVRRTPTKT
ncbi:MAG: hypothetical protein KIT46_05855 [Anaerolineales bacterium]|nr:hypothetical protein [Anaerolineales bacterium]MCW5855557.1 hypothetical protein [Anaerolineales bacterium]